MKRLYTLLAGLTMAAGLMAQGQKLTGRIIDKDYYPMDKAKVTVKGTNISTTTDKNGNYVLEEVPLILDSLEVTKGKKSYSESFPVMIKMKQAIMAKPVEWYVKAGYDITTPVIVSNMDAFADVSSTASGPVKELDDILIVR